MGEYGYAYRSISIYSTTRNGGTREPPAAVIKKPFVPKSNGNNYSQDAVTRKKIVPIVSRSYDDPAATGKYPSSGSEDESDDDDRHHRQTSPVRSSPHKVRNHEGSHNPQPFGPIVDRGRHAPQLTAEGHRPIGGSSTINHDGANYVGNKGHKLIGIDPIGNHNYDGANGYGGDRRAPIVVGDPKEGRKSIGINPNNYDGTNGNGGDRRVVRDPKEGYKPIAISPIRNDNYDGTNGYGGDRRAIGDPKEGYKPIGVSPIKSGNYDDTNGYSGNQRVVEDPKEGRKPIGINPIRSDNYDHPNGYGGDRRAIRDPKEGYKSIGISPIRSSNYDGTTGYGGDNPAVGDPKKGHKPIGINPIRSDNYDGTNGYGSNHHALGGPREGYKPNGISPIKSGNSDGNNGYGGDHRALGDPSKGYKPIGISPIRSDNYVGTNDYSGDRRVGDPNHYKEGRKPIGGGNIRSSHDGYNNGYGGEKEGRKPIGISPIKNENYDGPNGYGGDNIVNYNNRSNPNGPKISSNWSTAPRQGIQLSEPTNDIDKAMELLKMEAAKRDHQRSISNNAQYYDGSNASPQSIDSRGSATAKPYGGNFIQSQPRMSPTCVTYIPDDDDDYNYYTMDNTGRYGGHHDSIIDSREAEKKFKGTRV